VQYDSVTTIIRNLNEAGVRYLVVGGLAVVAYGYVRFTADVDLLLGLESVNAQNAMRVFKAMGYTPRAPVPIETFSDPAMRQLWIREKAMAVFSLYSPLHPGTEIDIFVEDTLGFDQAVKNAKSFEIARGVAALVCSLSDLIKLKAMAGRPQDLLDIQKLTALHREMP
jgi:predicted nucleotidyltransferase